MPSRKPTTTPAPTTPTLGRPRGGASLDGGKYGRCPRCATGRRIRSRYNPHGASVHRGKFRFVCSSKAETGCDYSETLDDDPALCPDLFSGRGNTTGVKGGAAGGGGGGQGEEEEDEEEGDFEILGQSAVVTPSKAFGRRAGAATIARDKPPQNLGCPECMVGRLAKRRRDNSRFTETMLVCEKAWNGKDVVGGCGYQIDIGADPVEEGPARGASAGAERAGAGGVSATVAKAREEIKKLKKKSAREIAREKKEMDEWMAQERARALANPYAAAVMVAPNAKPKKKIVVDLTDDGEFTSLPPRGPPGGSAVGAYAPIFIEDDEDEIAQPIKLNRPTKSNKPDKLAKITKFDEFGSDDEMDLVRLAEEAAAQEAKDGMYEEDELALMELADQYSSPMPAN
ncbi:hypothetical protein B0I37DRAFT_350153 [Chaetomium sp. MPI-CAGE-AT-0009]|nr:hypothetical protein B0I37DRAFT_350153 [Chaetomium sp. MPI-CAGE-AT-0009]